MWDNHLNLYWIEYLLVCTTRILLFSFPNMSSPLLHIINIKLKVLEWQKQQSARLKGTPYLVLSLFFFRVQISLGFTWPFIPPGIIKYMPVYGIDSINYTPLPLPLRIRDLVSMKNILKLLIIFRRMHVSSLIIPFSNRIRNMMDW